MLRAIKSPNISKRVHITSTFEKVVDGIFIACGRIRDKIILLNYIFLYLKL